MKNMFPRLLASVAVTTTLLTVQLAPAQTLWSGGGGADMNWSTAGNWFSGAAPSSSDSVVFTNNGAVATVSNINNIVDSAFIALGGTIASLQYANTSVFHTTLIPPGQTLTVNASITAGTEVDGLSNTVVTATITGPGGAINQTSGNLVARQTTSGGNNGLRATLDMSGLDTYTAAISRVVVGSEGPLPRSTGTLYLAKTNIITLSGSAPMIAVGGRGGPSSRNAGGVSHLLLGQTNAIFANSISVGRAKQGTSGGQASSMRFNTNSFASSTAYVRGADTASRVLAWNVADSEGDSGTMNTAGAIDFTGGTLDAQVDNMVLAKTSSNSGGNGSPVGTFTFTAGTLDVNTLQIGYQNTGGPAANAAFGTMNVLGTAKLAANTSIELGHISGSGTNANRGVLNIAGGTVAANTIFCGIGTNTIALANGALIVSNAIGSASAGVFNLNTTNSILTLSALNGTASAAVTNLVTDGATNKINIGSIPPVTGYPVQFTLIKYSGAIGGAGFNFGLGTLPTSIGNPYAGYLSNNAANSSVDLVLTAGLEPAKALTWNGTPTANWEAGSGSVANWLLGSTPTNFNQTDFVTFNDSAAGLTSVNLTTTLLPTSVTVSNNARTYTFTGSGYLSGSVGLSKQGAGTLIVDNSGPNDFTGGIDIDGGTLQFGNNDYNAMVPAAGAIVDNSTLAFNQQGDITVPNVISGTGAVTTASGTLRLSGANSFSGPATVSSGTLVPLGNGALGATAGATTIAPGATLDVGGSATANSINLGTEPIIVSGAGVGGSGAIVNNTSTAQQNALRVVTLAGNTTFGGSGRWDIRGSGATLMTGSNAYNITKIGGNQVSLVGVNPIDPMLGDVDIQSGIFAIQTSTAQLGDPAKTITVRPNATLSLYQLSANPLNKQIVLQGNSDGLTSSIDAENGNNIIAGPVTLSAPSIIGVRGTTLTLANSVSGVGPVTKNGNGALILDGPCSYSGGTLVTAGSLIVDGTLAGGVTNWSGTQLAGSGTSSDFVDAQGTFNAGPTNGIGTFTAAAGMWLEGTSAFVCDLGPTNTASGGVNDLLAVTGNLTVDSVPVTVNAVQGRLQAGAYRLANYSGSLLGAGFSGAAASGSSRYSFAVDTSVGHQVNLIVTGSSADLKWAGTFDSTWGIAVGNWNLLPGGAPDSFYNGDSVLLDDSVAGVTNTLSLSAGVAVLPWAITNNSSVNSYTILGAGKISGGTGLQKAGSSTLTILTTNDFTGPVNVLSGTLKVGSSGALGATNSGTTIAGGATLDVGAANMAANVLNLGFEQVTVSGTGVGGNGAIISSGTNQQQNALRFVTMAGDTTIGGTILSYWLSNNGRWDIRGTGNTDVATNTSAVLSTGGQPYSLTKVGSNQVSLVGVLVDPALANINILGGALSIEHGTTLGDPNRTITVTNGATLMVWQTWSSNLLNKAISLYGDGLSTNVYCPSGDNIIVGPITLNSGIQNSNCVIGVVGATLTFSNNTLSGSAGLTKVANGRLNLYGTQTYLGNTVVSGGTLALGSASTLSGSPTITVATGATLDVSGRADGTLTLSGAQTLAGNGTINGSLVASPGTTVSPGASIGALTVTNAVILGGTTVMELGAGTNDVIRGAASIQYGGTLNLVFAPGSLAAGNAFKLFSAGAYSGSFTLSPAEPGAGLGWDTSTLATDGTLRVVQTVNTTPVNIAAAVVGGNLELSWPADHTGWRLQAQTNSIYIGLGNNWADVPNSTTTNRVVITPNQANGSVFYRMVYP